MSNQMTSVNLSVPPAPPKAATLSIVWCDHFSFREQQQPIWELLCSIGARLGLPVVRFKKAYNYHAWLSNQPVAPPHVLVTDWREFKPCNIFISKVGASAVPASTVLVLNGHKVHDKAAEAVDEVIELRLQRRVLICHNMTEIAAMADEVVVACLTQLSSGLPPTPATTTSPSIDVSVSYGILPGSQTEAHLTSQDSAIQPFWQGIRADWAAVGFVRNLFPCQTSLELEEALKAALPSDYEE